MKSSDKFKRNKFQKNDFKLNKAGFLNLIKDLKKDYKKPLWYFYGKKIMVKFEPRKLDKFSNGKTRLSKLSKLNRKKLINILISMGNRKIGK